MTPAILASCEPIKAERVQGRQFWLNPGSIKLRRADGSIVETPPLWRSDGISWPAWIFGAVAVVAVLAVFGYLAELPIYVPIAMGGWALLMAGLWVAQPREALRLLGFLHDWACQNTALYSERDRADIFRDAAQALRVPALYWWPMLQWISRGKTPTQWPQPDFNRTDSPWGVTYTPKTASKDVAP